MIPLIIVAGLIFVVYCDLTGRVLEAKGKLFAAIQAAGLKYTATREVGAQGETTQYGYTLIGQDDTILAAFNTRRKEDGIVFTETAQRPNELQQAKDLLDNSYHGLSASFLLSCEAARLTLIQTAVRALPRWLRG